MKYISLLILALTLLISCADAPPSDYVQENYIEAYLYVGKPVSGIKVMRTLPVTDKYSYDQSAVKDAKVIISGDNRVLNLSYRDGEAPGYYYNDSAYLVAPLTVYNLRVELADGRVFTGETKTPRMITWVKEPRSIIYYPQDTTNLPSVDSISISWQREPDVQMYLLSIDCLDTLDYGAYLTPPDSANKNRRCHNAFVKMDDNYKTTYFRTFMSTNQSPVVWMAFKWFGKQVIEITAPDNNFIKWYQQYMNFAGNSELNKELSSINGSGGFGVFGSATIIRKEMFLMKNQK